MKTYEVFKTFNVVERNYVIACIQSLPGKRSKDFLKILKYWESSRSEDSKKNRSELFRYLFPSKKSNDSKMRLLLSALYSELIRIIPHVDPKFQDRDNQIVVDFLRRRGKEKLCESELKKWKTQLDKNPIRNETVAYERYQYSLETYNFASKVKRSSQLNLQRVSDNIDVFYLAAKLRQACFMMAHQSVYKTDYNFGLLTAVLDNVNEEVHLAYPAINVYYYGFLALNNPKDEGHFAKLKSSILLHTDAFEKDEIRDIYLMAINYCIRRINRGHLQFANEGLDLYKNGLESGALYENNKLTRFTFANIIGMAIKLKKLKWTGEFIAKYHTHLESKFREETYHFNLARLLYAKKAYDEAMIMLQKADYEDVINAIIARTLLMKIYFETGEIALLEYHLDAMLVFISRKKIIGYHQKNYLNIVRYTKRLIRLKPGDENARAKLVEMVNKEDILTEKEWLLDQIQVMT